MHKESRRIMRKHIHKYGTKTSKVLDVGSKNYGNGSYKVFLKEPWFKHLEYTGIDLEAGDNVDIVLEDPYVYPFEDDTFDLVICGQVLEHCENPFKLMDECARVLKPGGFFVGVAPFVWAEHRYPVDCWRILPDGWKSLFKHSKLKCFESYISVNGPRKQDCWGIARKVVIP